MEPPLPRVSAFNFPEHTGVHVQPDRVNQTQWLEIHNKRPRTPEENLLFAILETAIKDFTSPKAKSNSAARTAKRSAKQWINDRERTDVYSFNYIADHFGMNGEKIREKLRSQKKERLHVEHTNDL